MSLDEYAESCLSGKALAAFRAATGLERDELRAKALSQWMTSDALAGRIVAWAGIKPGQFVLEPSCGTGSFVRAARAAGADVTSVDIDPQYGADVTGDYLETRFTAPFDFVLENPPYEGSKDADFLEKAAADATDVVALIRLAALAGTDRYTRVWQHVTVTKLAILSSRPSYEFMGKETESPRSDFVVVKYTLREGAVFEGLEWWQV